jgi:hypothetical protein
MYSADSERLQHIAQAIAARRRERRRIILRRLSGVQDTHNEGVIEKKRPDLALRTAQARAILTTRKN